MLQALLRARPLAASRYDERRRDVAGDQGFDYLVIAHNGKVAYSPLRPCRGPPQLPSTCSSVHRWGDTNCIRRSFVTAAPWRTASPRGAAPAPSRSSCPSSSTAGRCNQSIRRATTHFEALLRVQARARVAGRSARSA